MKTRINLHIIRRIQNNTIIETFYCNLFNERFMSEQTSEAYHIVRDKINACAIHNDDYKLLDIQYTNISVTYIYNYNGTTPNFPASEQYLTFVDTWRGDKKCSSCGFLCIDGKSVGCRLFGKVTKRKCTFWDERRKNRIVHWSSV